MANKDYAMVLLEQLVDQNKAILEYVGEMPKMSARLEHVEQVVDELRTDMKVVKSVVREHSGELAELDARVSALEAA
jgi:chromosome segregation ATPase